MFQKKKKMFMLVAVCNKTTHQRPCDCCIIWCMEICFHHTNYSDQPESSQINPLKFSSPHRYIRLTDADGYYTVMSLSILKKKIKKVELRE